MSVSTHGDNSSFESIVRFWEAEVLRFYNANREGGAHEVQEEGHPPAPLTM